MHHNNESTNFAIGILTTDLSSKEANRLAMEAERTAVDEDPELLRWVQDQGWELESYSMGQFTHILIARDKTGAVAKAQMFETILAEVA